MDNDDEDSSDGESIEHHELARRESAVVGDDYQDSGVGAFDSLIDQALPEIHEDVTYREEQERIAEEIEHEQHEVREQGRAVVDARRAFIGRHGFRYARRLQTVSELPITFPSRGPADYLAGGSGGSRKAG